MSSRFISKKASRVWCDGDGVGVAVVGSPREDAQRLPIYKDHQGRRWVGGELGAEFGIEVIVTDAKRHRILIEKDGMNILNPGLSSSDESLFLVRRPNARGDSVIWSWRSKREERPFRFDGEFDYLVSAPPSVISDAGIIRMYFILEPSSNAVPSVPAATTDTPCVSVEQFSRRHLDLCYLFGVHLRYATEGALKRAGYRRIGDVQPAPSCVTESVEAEQCAVLG